MEFCEYGCGQEANYILKNGKKCCSPHWLKCPNQRKKRSKENNFFYNRKHSKETKNKISLKNKGKKAWNKGIKRTEEEKKLISIKTKEKMNRPEVKKKITKPKKYNIKPFPNWKGGYSKKNIPLYETYCTRLIDFEEIRQNPLDKKILDVRCLYCGKWFTPTITQVYERIRCFSGLNYGEQRFYCSEYCKSACPIFHQISNTKENKSSYSREVQPQLRKLRFEKDNYTCQKCFLSLIHI